MESIKGLRVKPSYQQLIGVAVSDGLENIKFPNRNASFLRNGFVLSQLDGEGQRVMERQQEMASKEAYKEHLLKQIAQNNNNSNSDNISHHSFRTANEGDLREQRINNMLHARASEALQDNNTEFYDISDNTAEGSTQTAQVPRNEGSTQTERLHHVHVEDHRMEINILQQEPYNRELLMLQDHEQNVRQIQHGLSRQLQEISGEARRREIENQTVIDDLVNRVNHQSLVIADQQRHQAWSRHTAPQAIEDQQRLQAIEDQRVHRAIEDQRVHRAIEDQPAASSSSMPERHHQPATTDILFGKSVTGLLTIKSKTKGSWGKANKSELQGVLRDFNVPYTEKDNNSKLYGKVVALFESIQG